MSNGEGTNRTNSDEFEVPKNPDVRAEYTDMKAAAEDIAPGYSDVLDEETLELDVTKIDEAIETELTEQSLEKELKEHEKFKRTALARSKSEKFKNPLGHEHKEVTLLDFLFEKIGKNPVGHELTIIARITIARINNPDEMEALAEAIETTYLEELEAKADAAEKELDREFDKQSDNYNPRGSQIIDDLSATHNALKNELASKRTDSKKLAALLRELASIVRENGADV